MCVKMSLFQKQQKSPASGGSAPRSPVIRGSSPTRGVLRPQTPFASGGWGLCPQTTACKVHFSLENFAVTLLLVLLWKFAVWRVHQKLQCKIFEYIPNNKRFNLILNILISGSAASAMNDKFLFMFTDTKFCVIRWKRYNLAIINSV